MEKIKVGIIGCGFVASAWHIPAFIALKKTVDEIVVCDVNPKLAESVAKKFHLSKAYANVAEMLEKEKLCWRI